jgi:tetratricopeptide (TPR) repeat protein
MKHMLRNIFILFLLSTTLMSTFSQEKKDALKLYKEAKYQESIEVCKLEIAEMPGNMDSYTVLGWSLLALGRFDEAITQANTALAAAPYDHRIIAIKGEALYHTGKNREALKWFEQYINISPNDKKLPNIYSLIGEVYLRLGEYNNADIAFSTALHFDNKKATWWARLGYTREMSKEYQWALEAYENALKLSPDLLDAKRGLTAVKNKLNGG